MLTEMVGVCRFLRKERFRLFLICRSGNQPVVFLIGSLCVQLTGEHLGNHLFGDGKGFRRRQTDIQVVAVNALLRIAHRLGRHHMDFLIIGKHRSTRSHRRLSFLTEHRRQHIHHGFPLGVVRFNCSGNRKLTHGVRQHPVILAGFAKVRENDTLKATVLGKRLRHTNSRTDHRRFSFHKRLGNAVVCSIRYAIFIVDIADELFEFFKHARPHRVVQTHLFFVGFAFVSSAPYRAFKAHQLRNRAAL